MWSEVYRRNRLNGARHRGENLIAQTIQPVLSARYKTISRDLRRANLRKRLAKSDGLYKLEDSDVDTWNSWGSLFSENLKNSISEAGDHVLDVETQFFSSRGYQDLWYDPADIFRSYLANARTGKRIADISLGTQIKVNKAIADWFNTDAGLPELIKSLEKYFSPARAELIAITEMAYVASDTALQMMKNYAIQEWQWDAFNDGVTCDICLGLMEQSKIKPFSMSDPMPPHASHPRCRCGVFFIL